MKSYKNLAIEQGLRILQFDNLKIVGVDGVIMREALELMKKYPSLNPRDGVHSAVALASGASVIVTDDIDFDVVKELRRRKLE